MRPIASKWLANVNQLSLDLKGENWFKATSDTAYIFNIHVLNYEPGGKQSGRVYVDPNGEKLAGGQIRAEKLKSAEALKRYG